MRDFFVTMLIPYCGLCLGTWLNLQAAKISQIEKIFYAIFFPPIVLIILLWVAVDITKKDKENNLLRNIILCLSAYADAVSILYVESNISLKLAFNEWKLPIFDFLNRTKQTIHDNIATT